MPKASPDPNNPYLRAVGRQLILDFYRHMGLSNADYRGPYDLGQDAWAVVDLARVPHGLDRAAIATALTDMGHGGQAVGDTKNNPLVLAQIAQERLNAGNYAEAEALLNRALAIRPQSSKMQRMLGHALWNLARWSDASAAYSCGISILEPPLYPGRADRAPILVLQGYCGQDIYFEGGHYFAVPRPADSFASARSGTIVIARHRIPASLRNLLQRALPGRLIAAMRRLIHTTWWGRLALGTTQPSDLPHARGLESLLARLRRDTASGNQDDTP